MHIMNNKKIIYKNYYICTLMQGSFSLLSLSLSKVPVLSSPRSSDVSGSPSPFLYQKLYSRSPCDGSTGGIAAESGGGALVFPR